MQHYALLGVTLYLKLCVVQQTKTHMLLRYAGSRFCVSAHCECIEPARSVASARALYPPE